MEKNLLKEIHYLTRLIEQHKTKVPGKSVRTMAGSCTQIPCVAKSERISSFPVVQSESLLSCKEPNNSLPLESQLKSTNVYVNPNFKLQNSVIHINPKMHTKPLIHVNPKMMRDIGKSTESIEKKSENILNTEQQTKVVEKDMQTNVKRSVYVNPKLMKKLSSAAEADKKSVQPSTTSPACSRLKPVKPVNPKKSPNSSVIILSQRKLVRVKRGSKGTVGICSLGPSKIKRLSQSPFKKVRIVSQRSLKNTLAVGSTLQCPRKNQYKIDRTTTQVTKVKGSGTSQAKKTMNNTMELITIGGIVYKSSRNQLVRRSYSLKRKRTTSTKNDKFIVATNGKKLQRLKSTKEVSNQRTTNIPSTSSATSAKGICTMPLKVNYKTTISNKMKQKSIQILHNKMRKNNQPCLIFQRFGYCANQEKGTCPKRHDKKQISLCKKFLQGKCLLDNCPLSHDVGPEKMPTCKYFLEGCCTRDACPYRHVKVSSNTPICIEFLQGYCAKGNKCKRRHEYLCPEFEKTGNCKKGKYCLYPHKSHVSKQTDKYLKRKQVPESKSVSIIEDSSTSSTQENKLRYYERTETLDEDLEKKRENIMKKIKLMKAVEVAAQSDQNTMADTHTEVDQTDCIELQENETRVFKRPPIGSLPAYIPIN